MNTIQLDLRNLLGFKIINAGPQAASALISPKIGDKQCPSYEDGAATGRLGPLSAKVGSKTG